MRFEAMARSLRQLRTLLSWGLIRRRRAEWQLLFIVNSRVLNFLTGLRRGTSNAHGLRTLARIESLSVRPLRVTLLKLLMADMWTINCGKLWWSGFCRALLIVRRCRVISSNRPLVEPVIELALRINGNGKSVLALPVHFSREVKQKGITK